MPRRGIRHILVVVWPALTLLPEFPQQEEMNSAYYHFASEGSAPREAEGLSALS
jgi:hypothetical protein